MMFKNPTPKSVKPFAVWLLLPFVFASACAPQEQEIRTDVFQGKALYDARCAACHGARGEGAGPESLGLGQAPPSLRSLSDLNGGVFPREYVMATIDGLSRHNQAAAMPEFGAGDMGPLVQIEENGLSTPTPADLIALTAYIESIQD